MLKTRGIYLLIIIIVKQACGGENLLLGSTVNIYVDGSLLSNGDNSTPTCCSGLFDDNVIEFSGAWY